MCLILFAAGMHPDYPLIVAANRDEFHARPTASSHVWQVPDGILAGRDLQAGGTWLGVNRRGQFAAITNVSERVQDGDWLSRGDLVKQFLGGANAAVDFAAGIAGERYRGFNLLLRDGDALVHASNRGDTGVLADGIHGIANADLGEDRFKVRRGTEGIAAALESTRDDDALVRALFAMLTDRTPPPMPERHAAGLSASEQQALGACFIVGRDYGTRASTLVLIGEHGARVIERIHGPMGADAGCSEHSLPFHAVNRHTESYARS